MSDTARRGRSPPRGQKPLPEPLQKLYEIAIYLMESDHPDGNWFFDAVGVAKTGKTLDAAFQYASSYKSLTREETKDVVLIGLTRRTPPELTSCNAVGEYISRRFADYQRRRWPQDKANQRRPDNDDNLLFDYLMAKGTPSAQRIRKRLAELVAERPDITNVRDL